MKKSIIVIIALIYSFLNVNMVLASPDTWTQKADFGGINRTNAVGFSIGSKGYIGTGFDVVISGGPVINFFFYCWSDFWEYDSDADTWTQKADFGWARDGAVGFSIGNKGYIGTGYDDNPSPYYYKDFWEYDPSTNTWTQRADFGGTARSGAVGFSIGSKGYIGTGGDSSSYCKDFWEYDPTANTWTQKADFGGIARAGAVGFSIGSNGYIGTGEWHDTNVSQYKGTNDFWEYSPTANTWTQKADFGGTARDGAVGFSIGNRGYIGTGDSSSANFTNDFWEYEPATNTWTQRADFGGTARSGAVGFFIGSKGYIGTGSWDTNDFLEYEPADTTPDPFTFTDQTGVALSTVTTSNIITVSGIDVATPISITGGTYAINGGSYTSTSGTVSNGDTVTVQLNSSGRYFTTTNTTLTIGGVSGIFSVTTQAAPASGGKSGCFIATAAFGSPLERHVQILRDFRDRYLLNTKPGQKFVKLYYQISPPIAGTIAKSKVLRMFTRWCLMPVIGVAYLIVMFGIVPTLLIITISFLMLFYFDWLQRKRFKHDLRCSSAR